MKELTRTALYCAMFIAVGAVAGVLGPSLIYLADLIDASVAEISIVFSARAIGNILGALLAGRMFDRWQGHHYLILMLLLMIVGLLLVPFSTSLWMLVVLFFLLGGTEVSANAGGNMMMLWLHKEKVGSFVTILHLCHSAGAMLAPLILVFAQWATGQTYGAGYWMIALYTLLLPVFLWKQASPTFEVRANELLPTSKQNTTFIAFLTVIFLYVGFEITIAGWISTYAVLSGEDQNTAAILVTWFFVSLSLGRLFSVLLLRFITPQQGIYSLLLVSFSGTLMLIFSDVSLVFISLWLGLGCSAFFPMLFSYANSIMALNGKRTGYVFVCCGLGALVAPSLTGPIIEAFSADAFPYLLLVLVLLLALSWQRLASMTRSH
ncbi:MAG: MFS transporter [Oceanospirillaceae bacterium]|nr:MFS transporter [Oceanospirillaceae bacterium]